jgi:hypothetical protein
MKIMSDELDLLADKILDLEFSKFKKQWDRKSAPAPLQRGTCSTPCVEIPLSNIKGPGGKRLMKAQAGNNKYSVGQPHWECAGCKRR